MSADPIEATQTEFAHLSKLQLEKHTTDSPDAPIESIFAGAVNRRTWYSTFPHKLESEYQNEKIKYKSLHTPDYLAHVYIVQQLPALRVKDKWKEEIRICWPHNCGNNITTKGEFVIGSSNIIQTIDNKWMDDHHQMMIENGYEKFIKKCQGNFPFLEDWNTFLPEYALTPMQPFFIDSDTEMAFPIYRIDPQKDISIKYKIRRNFREMLRMKKKCVDGWKEICFNKTYIEGNFGKDELPLPEMYGIYYKISSAEIDVSLEADENGVVKDTYEQMINEVIVYDRDEKHSYGANVAVELHSAHPCKFVTVKAENSIYEKSRNYSNYTTDEDVYKGSSPIKSFPCLSFGPTIKMEKLDSCHTDRMFPYYHAPRVPTEPGYNLIPFSSRVADFNFDVGVILSNLKVKLAVELGNTDPMITKVQIYREAEPNGDIIIGQEDFGSDSNGSFDAKQIDEVIEEKEEELKSNSKNKTTYKLIVRTVISKTLIYSRIPGSKYFNVHFRAHEEISK